MGSKVTTFFGFNNSGNIKVIKVFFFLSKCSKFFVHFKNLIKSQKMFWVSKIKSLELVVGISIYCEKNTCDPPSRRDKTVVTF